MKQPCRPRSAGIKTTLIKTEAGNLLQFDDNGLIYQSISRITGFVDSLQLTATILGQIDDGKAWSDIHEVQTLIAT